MLVFYCVEILIWLFLLDCFQAFLPLAEESLRSVNVTWGGEGGREAGGKEQKESECNCHPWLTLSCVLQGLVIP